jgi:hypothetical protein
MKRLRWPYGAEQQRQDAISAIHASRDELRTMKVLLDRLEQHLARTLNDPLAQMLISDLRRHRADTAEALADAERLLVLARYGDKEE